MFQAELEDVYGAQGVGEDMVVGVQLHRPPCHKLSHITSRSHTNSTRMYTLRIMDTVLIRR